MYIIIAGTGVIGQQIAKVLISNNHDIVAIDLDAEVCEMMYAETGALTINGNATDLNVLKKAGANKADVIITLMHNAADNIACGLLAKSLGIPKIVARVRNPLYENAYKLAGFTSVLNAADLLVNDIIMEVEQPEVKKIMSLGNGKANIYAVKIPSESKKIGMRIKDITQDKRFPNDCVFIGFYKEEQGDFLIPRGNHSLHEGDTVFLVSTNKHIDQATTFLTK